MQDELSEGIIVRKAAVAETDFPVGIIELMSCAVVGMNENAHLVCSEEARTAFDRDGFAVVDRLDKQIEIVREVGKFLPTFVLHG